MAPIKNWRENGHGQGSQAEATNWVGNIHTHHTRLVNNDETHFLNRYLRLRQIPPSSPVSWCRRRSSSRQRRCRRRSSAGSTVPRRLAAALAEHRVFRVSLKHTAEKTAVSTLTWLSERAEVDVPLNTASSAYFYELHRVSEKGAFLFSSELCQISILINFRRKMAKWLELYATYTFSTAPHLCHRTTNTDVPNCYITLEFITIRLRVRHPSVERPPTDLLNVDLVRRSRFSLTFFFLVLGRT